MKEKDKTNPVPSPCVGVCVLNMEDICEGCFRTAEEITHWSTLDNPAKKQVLEKTWQRAKEQGGLL